VHAIRCCHLDEVQAHVAAGLGQSDDIRASSKLDVLEGLVPRACHHLNGIAAVVRIDIIQTKRNRPLGIRRESPRATQRMPGSVRVDSAIGGRCAAMTIVTRIARALDAKKGVCVTFVIIAVLDEFHVAAVAHTGLVRELMSTLHYKQR